MKRWAKLGACAAAVAGATLVACSDPVEIAADAMVDAAEVLRDAGAILDATLGDDAVAQPPAPHVFELTCEDHETVERRVDRMDGSPIEVERWTYRFAEAADAEIRADHAGVHAVVCDLEYGADSACVSVPGRPCAPNCTTTSTTCTGEWPVPLRCQSTDVLVEDGRLRVPCGARIESWYEPPGGGPPPAPGTTIAVSDHRFASVRVTLIP